MTSIKLASLNIERSAHLDVVSKFITRVKPDILCVQELLENDIDFIRSAFGGELIEFAPMLRHMKFSGHPIIGVGIFSRLPVTWHESQYYYGSRDSIPDHDETPDRGATMNCPLVLCDVLKEGNRFRIGTTHFTWSQNGEADDLQRRNMRSLLDLLPELGELVFCGDFNAPRGGELWNELAKKYKDNIPADVISTIDPELHRAKGLELVVDGIFSTPDYVVSNIEMISGISDHKALVAKISVAG